jgi:hypothetical protein
VNQGSGNKLAKFNKSIDECESFRDKLPERPEQLSGNLLNSIKFDKKIVEA